MNPGRNGEQSVEDRNRDELVRILFKMGYTKVSFYDAMRTNKNGGVRFDINITYDRP